MTNISNNGTNRSTLPFSNTNETTNQSPRTPDRPISNRQAPQAPRRNYSAILQPRLGSFDVTQHTDTRRIDPDGRLGSIRRIDFSEVNTRVIRPTNRNQHRQTLFSLPRQQTTGDQSLDVPTARIATLINNTIESQRRTHNLQLEAFENLEAFPLTAENLAQLENNSRGYLINETEEFPLSQLLRTGNVGDNLVYSDGWVFDYRELNEYAQHATSTYTVPAGVITNPITRAPIDLRSEAERSDALAWGAGAPPFFQRPQRIIRSDLERLLQGTTNNEAANPAPSSVNSEPFDAPAASVPATLNRSHSSSSIATSDEMDPEYQIASFIKRYDSNSGARLRRLDTHLLNAFRREVAGEPTILTQGVRTRDDGHGSALDVAAHYGRVSVVEEMLEMSDSYSIQIRSARGEPEAAILARAERNEGQYDDQGHRVIQDTR